MIWPRRERVTEKNSLATGRGRRSPTRSLTAMQNPLGPMIQPSTHRNKLRPTSRVQPSPPQPNPAAHHNQNPRLDSDPPDNPHFDPRPLHTRRPLVVPRGTSVARHPLGFGSLIGSVAASRLCGLSSSRNLFSTCLVPFRPSRTWFWPF